PQLSEEATRVPVPGWVERLQAAYSRNVLVGLAKALLAPARARTLEAGGKPRGYLGILGNFGVALVPLGLAVVTMGGLWWYVVIHKKSIDAPEVAGLQPLGGAAVQAEVADEGTSTAFYVWFGVIG